MGLLWRRLNDRTSSLVNSSKTSRDIATEKLPMIQTET